MAELLLSHCLPLPTSPLQANPIGSEPGIATIAQFFRQSKGQTFLAISPFLVYFWQMVQFFFPSLTDVDVIYTVISNVWECWGWNKSFSAIYPAKVSLVVYDSDLLVCNLEVPIGLLGSALQVCTVPQKSTAMEPCGDTFSPRIAKRTILCFINGINVHVISVLLSQASYFRQSMI